MKHTDERGFILAATLWFVALLALAAVVIEGWIASSLDRGATLGERVAAQSALISAEQHIAYDLAFGSASRRGLELEPRASVAGEEEAGPPADAVLPQGPFIALDNRPYRIGDVVVRLQDGGGLYDLNNADRDTLGKLLKSYGVASNQAETLASALMQYTGKPADIGAGGIRDGDYLRAGLPLPRHAPLLTPWELLRVLGWERRDGLWRGRSPVPEIATLGPIGGLNINTASARMLTALAGIDEPAAARLVLQRTARPITDLRDLDLDASVHGREDRPLGFMPSSIIRLKLTAPGEPLMRIIEIRLTPTGTAPLRLDYVVDLPPGAIGAAVDAPPLPEAPAPQADDESK